VIRIATKNDISFVCQNMRAEDYLECQHSEPGFSPETMAEFVSGYKGFTLCAIDNDGVPAGIGGINYGDGQYGTAWAVGTDDFSHVALEITRACKKACHKYLERYNTMLFANSWDEHSGSAKWLSLLGFEPVNQYNSNKQPFTLFAMGEVSGQ